MAVENHDKKEIIEIDNKNKRRLKMYQPRFVFRLAEMFLWAILISALVTYAGTYLTMPIYYTVAAFDAVFGWLPFVTIASPEHLAMTYERWAQSTDGFTVFRNVSVLVLIASPILLMIEIMIVRPAVKS